MDNETITIRKENLLAAYDTASQLGADSTIKVLVALFGEDAFSPRDITERVKTFDEACRELGDEHPLVSEWRLGEDLSPDLEAYLRLRIVCAALNEGWQPRFTRDETRYYPWFFIYTSEEMFNMADDVKRRMGVMPLDGYVTEFAGIGYAYSADVPSNSNVHFGSRLCLRSERLAEYCGKQFIGLWADLNLVRRR